MTYDITNSWEAIPGPITMSGLYWRPREMCNGAQKSRFSKTTVQQEQSNKKCWMQKAGCLFISSHYYILFHMVSITVIFVCRADKNKSKCLVFYIFFFFFVFFVVFGWIRLVTRSPTLCFCCSVTIRRILSMTKCTGERCLRCDGSGWIHVQDSTNIWPQCMRIGHAFNKTELFKC